MNVFTIEKERKKIKNKEILKNDRLSNIETTKGAVCKGSIYCSDGVIGEEDCNNDSDESNNKNKKGNNNRGLFSRISTKCLIIFSICAIIIIVICSIFMAIVTTSILIKTNDYNKELLKKKFENILKNDSELSLLSSAAAAAVAVVSSQSSSSFSSPSSSSSSSVSSSSSSSNSDNYKLERNVFSWITDTIKKSFLNSDKNFNSDFNEFLLSSNKNQFLNIDNERNLVECGVGSIKPHVVNTRIMNGREAVPYSWPWAVSIGLEGPREYVPHACGGTLINRRFVITAAHCVMKNSVFGLVGGPIRNIDKYSSVERMMRIYVGVHDRLNDISNEKIYNVESIKIHENFDSVTFKNDLALIKLDRDIEQSDYVRFICLTKTESQVVPGDTIYAIGWGYTENSRNQASRFLMQVDLIVQRKENCLIQYIDSDQFCAGNVYQRKDTCNGDSGGPLLKYVKNKWTLVGVVSNGDVTCSGTGIYINVPFFYDWIAFNSRY